MFNRWTRRLSVRLWLTGVVAFAAALYMLVAGIIYAFNHYPQKTLVWAEQRERISQIKHAMHLNDNGCLTSINSARLTRPYNIVPNELMYRVLDHDGRVLNASEGAQGAAPWLAEELSDVAGHQRETTLFDRPFHIATDRVASGTCQYYVQVAVSDRIVQAIVDTKVGALIGIATVAVLLTMVAFGLTLTFTLHRQLKPLRLASREAAALSTRNLTARLSVRDLPSEIEPLITAFNDALSRLEHGFLVQKQFLASTAHELQTPLTLIRGQIELQPDIAGKAQLFRDIDLMARQVGQLLHLAEVSEVQNFSCAEIDPSDMVRDVVGYLETKARGRHVMLDWYRCTESFTILADAGALFVLLKNLVENAINVSPPDGAVMLVVDRSSIHVIDEGPGIPDEHVPFLFDRFWRAPGTDYDGAGLGLAICKEIAVAHRWTLLPRRDTSGTTFVIRFAPDGSN
ncbi:MULTISPECIES: sensor histidine kinase [Paraburkholderia]|uniref:sensor histidine kinase n=1 Tax=Paraburkholderia TaxID=1822464 RepID=UPI002864C391|nr:MULTISPECIES: ATP-binding protein [Paraburkholderia]MDR6383474.1 signal transduction histidine kinase [Paraburkholderia caribensis]MDR6388933.1 signal transduction histidine kinase [Paraburkholderia phenoliruptrix]MDR6419244.1 signal transduction histidine kinase [Paraburkholderia phenoliruptrix]